MVWFGPQSGDCSCCGGGDSCCLNKKGVSLSGLTNTNCTSGCDDRDGTYVLRDCTEDPPTVPVDCIWAQNLSFDNCGGTGFGFVGGGFCAPGSSQQVALQFFQSGGNIVARVTVTLIYQIYVTGGITVSGYRGTWTSTAATCAALSNSTTAETFVNFFNTTTGGFNPITGCTLVVGSTGDICDLENITVNLVDC